MAKEPKKMVANNKKVYHDYFLIEKYEAGISLAGTEVKSLRMGKGSIKESFIRIENGEMIEDKEAGEGIYLSDFSDEELMELCRTFENNSDVIIDYMMEKGKLKEMEKNEKG